MTALLIIHFGAPRDRAEIAPFLDDIFSDHYGIFAKPIALLARHSALKKYAAVGFTGRPEALLLDSVTLRSKTTPLSFERNAVESRTHIFLAAQYGRPSIEEVLEKIDAAGIDEVKVVPLYPHASLEMYDQIFEKIYHLKRLYFRSMRIAWAGPFYDNPLFIDAWKDSVKKSLDEFENKDAVRLIFCAHAIPLIATPFTQSLSKGEMISTCASTSSARTEYDLQVECSAKLICQALGFQNPLSIAYQSAMGRNWSSPFIEAEISRLAQNGVLDCLIAPISFLFDNVETLFDIDRVAIPAAKRAGMRDVRRATPPGSSEKIVNMFLDITKGTIDH